MQDPSQVPLPMLVGMLALLGASIAAWIIAGRRRTRGQPIVPYEARRPVPWRWRHVLIVFAVFELPAGLGLLAGGAGPAAPDPATASEQFDTQHPIVALLQADGSLAAWLLCGLLAVVVAPVVEEFTYRLLLQGRLEADERRWRRRIAFLRRLPSGTIAVVLVSTLFALRHFRTAQPTMSPDVIMQSMVLHAVWSGLTFAFALVLLRTGSGATWSDLGFASKRLLGDLRLGLWGFAAVCTPVVFLQYVTLVHLQPQGVSGDPIPLLPLALMLGLLYYRTHRLAPAIVLHMAFNATNLVLFWLQIRGGATACTPLL